MCIIDAILPLIINEIIGQTLLMHASKSKNHWQLNKMVLCSVCFARIDFKTLVTYVFVVEC